MKGELLPVWRDMREYVWTRLAKEFAEVHPDIYCELFRALNPVLVAPKSVQEVADITDNPAQAMRAFRRIRPSQIQNELALVGFLESVHEVLDDLGGDPVANYYFQLLDEFLVHFSLRYELRQPCHLCPTLPGLFAKHVSALRTVASTSAHLQQLLGEFETALRDLRTDRSEARLKTCIQKQVNLLEALGHACPGVTANTMGAIADEVGTWPHLGVKDSLKKMYGFASDYPGIRHGGTPANAIRNLEVKDVIAVSIALAGLAAYVSNPYDGEQTYLG